MKNHMLHAVLALSLGITSPAFAEQTAPKSNDAAVLLQAAMHTEQVEGRLPEAIDAYKNVVAKSGANKAVAAQALLRLGAAYEKLGRPEARETYERVVRSYPDQPKAAAAAKARLAKVGGGAVVKKAQADITPRRVLDAHAAELHDMTTDGRLAVGRQRRSYGAFDVVLRDLSSGKVTVVVPGTTNMIAYHTRISDDGRFVAYDSNIEGERAIVHVIGVEPEARPRTLVNEAGATALAADWSPDGRSLLTVLIRYASPGDLASNTASSLELTLVDVGRGSLKPLARFDGWHERAALTQARFSPDGRHIAYLRQPSKGSHDRYVEVLDVAGGSTTVVGTAATRMWPRWSPDGGTLFYCEGAFERESLWAVPVQAGRAAGQPVRLGADAIRRPLGVLPSGSLLWTRRIEGENYAYVSDRRPAAGSDVTLVEGFGASWSSDGSQLAFIRAKGDGGPIVVRDTRTGQERSYTTPGRQVSWMTPKWFAGDTALLVEATDGDSHFLRVDLRTGESTPLLRDGGPPRKTGRGVISANGRALYLPRLNDTGTELAEIIAVDTTTGQVRVVTSLQGAHGRDSQTAGIALSPDEQSLAVMGWTRPNETASLLTVGTDGQGLRTVVPEIAVGWIGPNNLHWSRDGRSLLFTDFDARRNWRVMRVAAEGGIPEPDGMDFDTLQSMVGRRQLFPGNFNGFHVSPDGTRIVTSQLTMPKNEVWALDVAALMAGK